ncbi:hypothetical protein PAMP_017322 [Pampus punctatissimus]
MAGIVNEKMRGREGEEHIHTSDTGAPIESSADTRLSSSASLTLPEDLCSVHLSTCGISSPRPPFSVWPHSADVQYHSLEKARSNSTVIHKNETEAGVNRQAGRQRSEEVYVTQMCCGSLDLDMKVYSNIRLEFMGFHYVLSELERREADKQPALILILKRLQLSL